LLTIQETDVSQGGGFGFFFNGMGLKALKAFIDQISTELQLVPYEKEDSDIRLTLLHKRP
jgi:hypothetical protein